MASNDPITVDALAEVISRLTVSDRLNAKKDGTDDGELITYRMMHSRATKMGVTTLDFDEFVDTIGIADLRQAQIKAAELMAPLVEAPKDAP